MTNVASALNYWRKAEKKTVREVADLLGYKSVVSVYNIETGAVDPSYSATLKLARAMGISDTWVGLHPGYVAATPTQRLRIDNFIAAILKEETHV